MIDRIRVQNYKLFQDFEILNIKRINIIGGKNNVGKSSLLEAIFLFHDIRSSNMLLKSWGWRGQREVAIKAETILEPIFNDFDLSKKIKIKIGKEELSMTLNKQYVPKVRNLDATHLQSAENISSTKSLDIVLKENNKELHKSHLVVAASEMTLHSDKSTPSKSVVAYISSRTTAASDAVAGFSKLDEKDETDIILKVLQIIEPRLEALSLNMLGNKPMVYGKLKGISKKFPIAYMGDGVNKILSIITRMAENKNSIILIDEIENGFHHTTMVDIWKMLSEAATLFNCQLFVTTHSYETLEAAYRALESNSNDYMYLRLDRDKNNKIVAKQYKHSVLGAALENGWEVR